MCFSWENFSQKQKTLISALLTALTAGRALLKSKDPERAVFFHWVPTRGPPAAGSAKREKGRRSKIPPFSKGKDEISLVVEEWISGYQKGWVQLVCWAKYILGSKGVMCWYIFWLLDLQNRRLYLHFAYRPTTFGQSRHLPPDVDEPQVGNREPT